MQNVRIKRALVTGASSGIGFAITKHLLAIGWQVYAISRKAPDILHPQLFFKSIDLTETNFISQFNNIPQLDAIIYAAGIMKTAKLPDLNPNDGQLMWQMHVAAPSAIVNQLANNIVENGRIIIIGSRTASGAIGRSQYAATKSALIGLTRSWAMELLSKQITVNLVSPAATETPMLLDPARKNTPPKLPPIGRYIQPEEIAGTVEFLLSESAKSITGQNIIICGGSSF